MNKVTLHGKEYDLPCKTVSIGLNMQCHKVVTYCTILSADEEKDEVIIESEGIKILLKMKDLDELYYNNKKNRNMLQTYCDNEYIQWCKSIQ